MTQVLDIYVLCSDLIGIPFLEGGRDHRGIDCLGITLEVCRRSGRPFVDPWVEIKQKWQHGNREIERMLPQGWSEVSQEGPIMLMPLDVLWMRGEGGPQHVAPMIGQWDFLHATNGKPSSLERVDRFRKRILSVYRYRFPMTYRRAFDQ